ncbi:hypothetical protein NBRC116601_08320 [Cognatishimia sp. WU-CL00825]
MRKSLGVLLVSTMILASCGSRFNPVNWFGRAEKVETASVQEINPLIPRKKDSIFQRDDAAYAGEIIANVTELKIERASGGAVIRVKGVASTQGAYDVLLKPENERALPVDGVLTFTLLAVQPSGFRQGPERSRELTVAVFKTDQDLQSVRTIRVLGANGALQVRRR